LSTIVQSVILVILICLSALCSSSETAITSLGKTRIRLLASNFKKKQKALQQLADNPNSFITAILIMNNLVNVGASSVATLLFIKVLPQGLSQFQTGIFTTLVMTSLLLIFGEITPKHFAKNNAERYSLAIINGIYYSSVILNPFIWIFEKISNRILNTFGQDFATQEPPKVSEEQIKALIDLGQSRNLFAAHEAEMMKRIFSYDDMTAREVMVPRTETKTIKASCKISEARQYVAQVGHSRYPVYSEKIDNIIGTLYSKDLLQHSDESNLEIREIVQPAYYTPITKPINALLREFQKERVHLAVVIDEYGGMAGIITLEDILEEIVGEIEDEFDTHEVLIEEVGSGEAIAAGDAEVKHINRMLDLNLPEEDVTVGGLLMHLLEDIPEPGDNLSLDGAELIVEEASQKQIKKVRIRYDSKEQVEEMEKGERKEELTSEEMEKGGKGEAAKEGD